MSLFRSYHTGQLMSLSTLVVITFALFASSTTLAQRSATRRIQTTPSIFAVAQYRSKQTGAWSDLNTWERSTDGGTTWNPAANAPTSADGTVTIQSGHHVSLTGSDSVSTLIVNGFIQGSGNLAITGDYTNNFIDLTTGTLSFTGAGSTQTIGGAISAGGKVLINHTGAGGVVTSGGNPSFSTLEVQNGTISLNGSVGAFQLQIDAGGTLVAPAAGGSLDVSGSFTNNGTFNANGGQVYLDGGANVFGNTTFYDLISQGFAGTITFAAGSTQTVSHALALAGDTVNHSGPLMLRSSTVGTRWNIVLAPGASQAVSYLDVQDSNAGGGQTIAAGSSSVNSGNNVNWTFGATAANVPISGRVVDSSGNGVRGARVVITDSRGHTLTATTNAFGYYAFTGVPSGDTYIANATSRGMTFSPRVVSVNDAVGDLNIVAR